MNQAEALASLAPHGSRLHTLLDPTLAPPLAELEALLQHSVGPYPIDAICSDLFDAGGKRLRALAALVVADAVDVPSSTAIIIAEAVERTHGATLLHDDVIDEADTRRGHPAARRRWSNTLSVLGGDFLLLRAMAQIAELGVGELERAHRQVLDELLSAEVLQHMARRSGDSSVDGYLAVASGKTGSLFAFACSAPVLCCSNPVGYASLRRFGNSFGVAFQILDDVRDVVGKDATKSTGLDLADGVPSLPLRLAASEDPVLRSELAQAGDQLPSSKQLRSIVDRVRATGAVRSSLVMAKQLMDQAVPALAEVPYQERLGTLWAACGWMETEVGQLQRDCG